MTPPQDIQDPAIRHHREILPNRLPRNPKHLHRRPSKTLHIDITSVTQSPIDIEDD
jgi:hypothetical protein